MKIGIVGCAIVGSTSAYALLMSGIGREIVLVDVNRARAEAEANDIYHAVPFAHPLTVRAGEYTDLEGARVVVIAGGVAQRPGETRLQAAAQRRGVPADRPVSAARRARRGIARRHQSGRHHDAPRAFRRRVRRTAHTCVRVWHHPGHCKISRAPGTALPGGSAARARLRDRRTRRLGSAGLVASHDRWVESRRVRHGSRHAAHDRRAARHRRQRPPRRVSDHRGKGATYYGIGSAVARIVDVLLHDQRAILTICSRITGVPDCDGVTLALPHLVDGEGVHATIPLALDAGERGGLRRSAQVLREAMASLNLS